MAKKKKDEKDEKEQLAINLIGLAGIEGLGFSSAAELHVLLGVKNVHDVYMACKEGKIATLPGWGEVRQRKLKSSIELSVMWFQSHCKKKQREHSNLVDNEITENMAKTIGLDKELIQEIARAHAEALKNQNDEE
jgi:DNA polymerase/3'-5' exonuclease PolX